MVNILAVNCGSSTLKFKLIKIPGKGEYKERHECILSGIVDKIGVSGHIKFNGAAGELEWEKDVSVTDHAEAMNLVLDKLRVSGLFDLNRIDAIGHRMVHGGGVFTGPVLINDEVISNIEDFNSLAPLHNPPCLNGIKAAKAFMGESVPQVAVFDTAFHNSLPDWTSNYAIPSNIAYKHRIRRYGFHGLAHQYMTERLSAITSIPVDQMDLITLQLGNGCSAAAIRNGRSIETSMGFTPLEGLIMGTRSGDLDPYIPGFIMRQEGIGIEDVQGMLNKESGLLGISGLSADMRELLKAEGQGKGSASLAVTMFCYRIRKYIGAYLAVLNGARFVVFGGGIGENAPAIRDRVCSGFEWCGLELDRDLNEKIVGGEGRISSEGSKIYVYVIQVDETLMIARETCRLLYKKGINIGC